MPAAENMTNRARMARRAWGMARWFPGVPLANCVKSAGCGLMRMQTEMGVSGPVAEIGPFEGRFFIALAHALAPGEKALGIDLFDWPNPEIIDRFEANCARHGVPPDRRITWKADSRTMA